MWQREPDSSVRAGRRRQLVIASTAVAFIAMVIALSIIFTPWVRQGDAAIWFVAFLIPLAFSVGTLIHALRGDHPVLYRVKEPATQPLPPGPFDHR